MFVEANSLEKVKKKLSKLYMILVLRCLNQDFDHVRGQILTSEEIPSMESFNGKASS